MNYSILDDATKIPLPDVMALLAQTYWADKRTPEQVQLSMDNSRCYGVYLDEHQKLVAFARVISDFATTYYLCDVVVDRDYQHNGFGNALISCIESLPEYQGLRGILITRDAHTFYEKFGYQTLNGRAMVKGLNC